MAQLWWLRWLQIRPLMRLPSDAMFGQIMTNPYYQSLRAKTGTNGMMGNSWANAVQLMCSWCSTNQILLGAQGLRLLHWLTYKWLTEHTLMASHQCHGRLSHQHALLLNWYVMAVMTTCAFEFFHPVVQVEPGLKDRTWQWNVGGGACRTVGSG